MKRAPFIGSSAAVLLAGCGGSHVMRALPGVAPQFRTTKPSSSPLRLVPASADPIPANVMANPIIGEAWRFDGKDAPTGWMFAQGQSIGVSQNRPLFAVLGTSGGGDGKSTFALPKPQASTIIAVAGTPAASPAMLASVKRHLSHTDSLGPAAKPRSPVMLKAPSPQLLAERRLIALQVRVGASRPVRVTPEFVARVDEARGDARAALTAQLSAANRGVLERAVERYLSGQVSLYDGVVELAQGLTPGEADALVRVQQAMNARFSNVQPNAPADPRGDASRFAFAATITDQQIADATARGVELR